MDGKTITEALAERKVLTSRIAKKREAIARYAVLSGSAKDPIREEGGSPKFIERELQAIADLEKQQVAILRAIQRANAETIISINGTDRTVSEWLIWRRDIAPGQKEFLDRLTTGIVRTRDQAQKQGGTLMTPDSAANARDKDVVVNLSELQLVARVEDLEVTLGTLDGQLSLKNATVVVTY